ncbi:phospholipase A2-alpha-like isoform X1 [Phoenix dactylifera]|uniref:phospholipase A2 n=1 Tax=Phoenix dactylifera TaxID=42345 RepID=A0A8B9AL31_PHODC|nr:phospholipase A2-alpha-like isoform X1 [Phoenix dactylifera]
MDGGKRNLSSKLAILIFHLLLALLISTTPIHALNIGVQSVNSGITAVSIIQIYKKFFFLLPFFSFFFFNFYYFTFIFFSCLIVPQSKQQQCSRTCASQHCNAPPFLKYGKYCGILYSGCPGEKPCDALDACCMTHDNCVESKHNDYLNVECNENLLNCIAKVRASGKGTFKGNKCMVEEVVDVITLVMEVALLAGRALHKP